MDKKCKKMAKITNFDCFWPMLPPGNGPLMAIESWNMYKMAFKWDNPSLGMILSQRNHNLWTKNAKNGENYQFSLFLAYVTPWKWTFNGYKIVEYIKHTIQTKLSITCGKTLSQINHKLCTKSAKNVKNDLFSLFLTYVTPWKWTFKWL